MPRKGVVPKGLRPFVKKAKGKKKKAMPSFLKKKLGR